MRKAQNPAPVALPPHTVHLAGMPTDQWRKDNPKAVVEPLASGLVNVTMPEDVEGD